MEHDSKEPVAPPPARFEDLGLSDDMLDILEDVGYESPSPIQASFIPLALSGVDCTGQARTGTGKTAAFAIPILETIDPESDVTQALVLCPTRELSEQVANEIMKLRGNRDVRCAVLVGGRPINKQLNELRQGVIVAIGTPGRVIDLLTRRALDLSKLKMVVLDEADRMLDIGFRPDIEKILKRCPESRQTLLLTATLPPPVERLARRYMRDPQGVDLSKDAVVVQTIDQYFCTVDEDRKFGLLVRLLARERPQQALIFTRTKRGADRLFNKFYGRLPNVEAIHGDLPQKQRDRVMQSFRDGKIRMLIATDVVGRGIDVSGISHIINYDVPESCDDYVHRIGRTGRLSSDEPGRAFTFVTRQQGKELTNIEMRINKLLESFHIDGYEPCRDDRRRNGRAASEGSDIASA
ncbi:MAG: DEAD/DEAH box helicase [Planctomycetaceae bacterium]|nr:DEAD/DEAH box helicase [Planctomycetaceae bacterium]